MIPLDSWKGPKRRGIDKVNRDTFEGSKMLIQDGSSGQ